jgi:hypothetical protein
VDQANYTFIDDITPSSSSGGRQSNSEEEGRLIRYLLGVINNNSYRLLKVLKAYNYERIKVLGVEGLTLLFSRNII